MIPFDINSVYRFRATYSQTNINKYGKEYTLLTDIIFLKDKKLFRDHVWVITNHKPKLDPIKNKLRYLHQGDIVEFSAIIKAYKDSNTSELKYGFERLKSIVRI